jgi:hypothetical protein
MAEVDREANWLVESAASWLGCSADAPLELKPAIWAVDSADSTVEFN